MILIRDLSANEKDDLLNDVTHAVAERFDLWGITLSTENLYRINDVLTAFLHSLEEAELHL